MTYHQLYREQLLKAEMNELWDFISAPQNLKLITPEYMGFDISSAMVPDKMYEGMIISYKVSPFLGIKTDWVTEITHIRNNEFFVDEQRIGPYQFWHHQHHLKEVENGILMTDIVSYKAPFGFLGKIANQLFIRKKLESIFDFRFEKLAERYS